VSLQVWLECKSEEEFAVSLTRESLPIEEYHVW
jgi:hypothetical protein